MAQLSSQTTQLTRAMVCLVTCDITIILFLLTKVNLHRHTATTCQALTPQKNLVGLHQRRYVDLWLVTREQQE